MESRAKLLGHPIHQMLIVLPLGLLATAVAFDLLTLALGDPDWSVMAYHMIGAGLITGLLAAVFGLIDFLAIPPRTRARRIGLLHGVGNVVVVLLYAGSWVLRRETPGDPGAAAYALSFMGAGLALVTGWLGGELVDRLGVGVDDGAHLDAPNSITHRSPAGRDTARSPRA